MGAMGIMIFPATRVAAGNIVGCTYFEESVPSLFNLDAGIVCFDHPLWWG